MDFSPRLMRAVRIPSGTPEFPDKMTVGHLLDVVLTRDTWMHRIDVCRAVGVDPVLTPEHDGRLIEEMVAEWTKLYGLSVVLHLEGPAGGTFVSGDGGEELRIDAVEWIWILSGRGTGTGLLEKELPL